MGLKALKPIKYFISSDTETKFDFGLVGFFGLFLVSFLRVSTHKNHQVFCVCSRVSVPGDKVSTLNMHLHTA